MKRLLKFPRVLALLLAWAGSAVAATYTDGAATFTVTLSEIPGNYANVHVDAVWVTDSTGRFVKTLRRDAVNRINYLYQWIAARGSYTAVDGYTGATAQNYTSTQYNPITVTWNCRDTNNVLVPDGNYRFYVEFTDRNGQGPYTTNGLTFTKGLSPVTNTPASLPYMSAMRIVFTPIITHDLAVTGISPRVGYPNGNVTVRVAVTNLTSFPESFTVTLSNATAGVLLGSVPIDTLAGNTATNVAFVWDTDGVAVGDYLLEATASAVSNELSVADNRLASPITIRNPLHDVAVARVTTTLVVLPNTTSNVTVVVTNQGDFTESFSVTLADVTDGRSLGTNSVSNLAAFTNRSVNFSFNATGSSTGYHSLRAVAIPLPGDVDWLNNTNSGILAVAPGLATNTLVARGATWRYHDLGLNLTAARWQENGYYDGLWKSAAAPLGYGQVALVSSNLTYGPDANNKYPTYYFRRPFYVDFPPLSLTLRVRRDDGVVLYLNGAEGVRDNMPPGPPSYSTLALSSLGNPDQTNYFTFSLNPALVRVGENLLAAEIHQGGASSSDIGFDVELVAVRPNFPLVHNVAPVQISPSGDVTAGDQMTVSVLLTNQGNATETVNIYLADLTANKVLGVQTLSNFVSAGTATARFAWKTVGVAPGDHLLQAYTVIGGVTNWGGGITRTATVGAAFGLNAVNVAGSIGGRCSALASAGNLLFLGAGATLKVFDLSVPAAPALLGSVRLPGQIEDISAGTNQYVYVACGSAGVQAVDVSQPAAPAHRNSVSTSGHAYSVSVKSPYLFVADGVSGVRAMLLTNPAAPVMHGAFYSEGPARAVHAVSSLAYLLDYYKGFLILNVPNPAAPVIRGGVTNFEAPQALVVSNSMAYVVDGQAMLRLINVANASAPVFVTNLYLGAVGQSIAALGTTLYVAAGDSGLLTINAATPTAPVIVANNSSAGEVTDVLVAGSYAYVAAGFAGLEVYDLSNPLAPVRVASLAEGLRGADVAQAGGFGYVAAGEAGLRVYGLATPAAPVLVSTFGGALNARCVALAGSLACVGDGQYGLKLVNVANPSSPALLGAYSSTSLGFVRSVAVESNQVALTDGRKILWLDCANPGSPALRGSYDAPAFAHAVKAAAGRVYAVCGAYGLLILDRAAGLSFAGAYDSPGFATGISIDGNTAHLADGGAGWLVLDVSNPGSPAVLRSSAAEGPVADTAAAGAMVALADGANTARVMDVTNPLSPVPRNVFGPLVRALRMSLDGQVALAAEDEAGLAVLDLSGDVDRDGLPDAWESQIVNANPNDLIQSVRDVQPGDDFDGDGTSNYAEHVAGTSPIDPASSFLLTVQGAADGSAVTLHWNSQPGRTYAIYKSTDLRAGFTLWLDNIPATPPLNTHTDSTVMGTAFYIINVR